MHDNGGFYSALDADSEGVEGKYYTWQKEEIEAVLNEEEAKLICRFYDVSEAGNWEHTNILWVPQPLDTFLAEQGIDAQAWEALLLNASHKLLQYRAKRVRPLLDDKILLNWNALMVSALCKAYAALQVTAYRNLAEQAILFLETNCQVDENWYHTYKNGQARVPAFLDDYAYLIRAYIDLQEVTGDTTYLEKARQLTSFVLQAFGEENGVFCYYTPESQKDVVVRKKEVYDGATPSGNAVMALNLLYLGMVYDVDAWRTVASGMVESLGTAVVRYPTSFGVWASVIQQEVRGVNEVVMAGEEALQTIPLIVRAYIPNKILLATAIENEEIIMFRGKYPKKGTGFYLCRNYICEAEMKTPESLLEKIKISDS
jgi:hypothetical protein